MTAAPLVVFGEDWGAYPSSTQHLIAALLPGRKVLWVDSIGLRRPRLADARRAATKLLAVARPAAPSRPVPGPRPDIVFTPPVVPWPGSRLAAAVNRRLLGAAVRRQMVRAGIERPVLWASLPTAVEAVGTLGERAVVYYCGDDFAALDGVDHAPVLAAEARLVARADLILASHPALAGKFDQSRTRLLPHGVDFARFAAAAPVRAGPAETPVAGFVGTIDGRLDADALAAAAHALPHWRFELWGPIRHEVGPLAACANLALLGPLAPAEVPGRMRGWDVALLPYRDTAMVRSCNPLKLREYLASGTPVAATPLAALEGYRDLIEVGSDPQAFAAAVARAGAEGRARADARQARVAGESWQARAREVAGLLAGLPQA